MTDENSKKWNVFLAKVGVMFTFVTILFIIICQVIIRSFFKFNKSVIKQRYKSFVSFKILRITLGLFIIISSYVGLIFIPNSENFRVLATPVPFIIALVGNVILLVFLTSNEDAWKYLIVNIDSFKDRIKLDFERRKLRRKSPRNKVFPQFLANISPKSKRESNEVSPNDSQNIYVIDMENAVSESSF